MKLIKTGGPNRYECCSYDVIEHPETVGEFIKEVLKQYPKEWGSFYFTAENNKNPLARNTKYCNYKYGNLISTPYKRKHWDLQHIKNVSANGGWSLMNYYITLEEES